GDVGPARREVGGEDALGLETLLDCVGDSEDDVGLGSPLLRNDTRGDLPGGEANVVGSDAGFTGKLLHEAAKCVVVDRAVNNDVIGCSERADAAYQHGDHHDGCYNDVAAKHVLAPPNLSFRRS